MNIALPTIHAVRASSCVSASVRPAISVRSFVVGCVFASAAACAVAGPGGGDQQGPGRGDRSDRGDDRGQQMMQTQDRQRVDTRIEQRITEGRAYDTRADDQRRAQQEQTRSDVARRNNRMTPDERRDLRRQINEAGQDLYATPPRR